VQDWREIVTYFSYPIRSRDYSRWPDKPEAWRAVTEQYSDRLMELACKLLEVLSEAMGLEKEALTKACVDMDQKVVVNYYPKCPQPDLTPHRPRHHHSLAPGPGGWPPGHQGWWEDLDHRSTC